jgi:Concanavalin A-like lectin/glucanases superfamily/Secretion system C-terminal sorting domain
MKKIFTNFKQSPYLPIKHFERHLKNVIVLLILNIFFNEISAQSLISHYNFAGNANDIVGANNGIVNGPTLAKDRFGIPNNAYSFDGLNDEISLGNWFTLQNFTIIIWLKPNASQVTYANIIDNNHSGSSTNWVCQQDENNVNSYGFGTMSTGAQLSLIPDIWQQIALVKSATAIETYRNGSLVQSTPYSNGNINYNNQSLKLANWGGGGRNWKGIIDDLKIYDFALTSTQISQEYEPTSLLPTAVTKPGSGNTIEFDGINDVIEIPNIAFEDFTYELWIKTSQVGSGSEAISGVGILSSDLSSTSSNDFIPLALNGNVITTGSGDNGVDYTLTSTKIINDNKWHHVAVTRLKATGLRKIYIDGIENVSGISGAGLSYSINENIYVGADFIDNNYFLGNLDELRVWNSALTETQIRERMCRKINTNDALYTNLVAYYNFDETTFDTAFDGISNANNGTIFGSPTRLTSGAHIGNQSAHNYIVAGLPAANLSFNGQDNLAIALTEGTYTGEAGSHIYVVNEKPNTQAGITFPGANNRYFGVFNANITSPQYTAVYNYTDNPSVGTNENDLLIFKRNDNAATIWENANGMLNVTANTFSLTGQNTEYNLGFLANPLPLNLLSFSGKSTENSNELTWKTTNETNFSHFEIQRSEDAKKFEKIGEKKSDESKNYEYLDYSPFTTQNSQLFYRLKLIDLDGKYAYSKIISLQNEAQFSFKIYPNPVIDNLNITANLKEPGNYQIKIMDEIGRVKSSQNSFLNAGKNQISIPANSCEKGMYFVVIHGDNEAGKVFKFLK